MNVKAGKNQVNSITLVQVPSLKRFVIPAGAEITLKSEIVTPDNTLYRLCKRC